MFEGIVLAAGRSQRADIFKPAYLHRGRPLLLHAADCLAPWCRRIVVVAGFRSELVAALIAGEPRLELACNAAFNDGMFSSVQAGARAIDPAGTGFFVLPADCPLIGTSLPGAMIRAFLDHGAGRAVVPEHAGRGGHPVLLPAAARSLILAARTPATLRDVVGCLDAVRLSVATAAVLMDLDTRDDLAALAAEA